ncbi:MAG: T9SS type A sorting domain-containing protein [Candidatus Delongbacteria bacterium]|nr:T9SS type A sorting domain-containing protein [Candidatus Delongbacteria bacterium]
MKTKLTIFITLIAAFFLFAEDLTTWSRTYNGDFHHEDEANDVEQTSDGGYIVAGNEWVEGFLSPDWVFPHVRILKYNENGDTLWSTRYYYNIQNSEMWDDFYNKYAEVYDIEQTSDGGYIFCGYVEVFEETEIREKMCVVKLDKSGTIEWDKVYYDKLRNKANSIKQTTDGGYVFGGRTMAKNDSNTYDSFARIIKINSIGDTLWSRTYQESEIFDLTGWKTTRLYKLCISSDNDIYGIGYVYSGTDEGGNGWIVKLDNNGNKIWSNEFGTEEGEAFYDGQITNDNNIIALGNQFVRDQDASGVWLNKISLDGDSIWSKTIHSGVYGEFDEGKSIQQTPEGEFIIGAETSQLSFLYDWWVIKTDSYGDTLWTKVYGSDTFDNLNSIKCTIDEGYIVCGDTEGSYIVNNNGDWTDMWVLKLDQDGNYTGIMDNGELIINSYELMQNYPNPFNNQTNIEYSIQENSEIEINLYNSNGQFVQSLVNEKKGKGKHSVLFNANKFNSGIYYYQLKIDGMIKETKRMLYLR